MDSIITYLFLYNQYLLKIISQLILFIAKYIPLKQWAFEDSHSPEYQKFKVDKLPKIIHFEKVDYQLLLAYYKYKYSKLIKPVKRRKVKSIPENFLCPRCGAPHNYIYDNNGNRGQFQCKVCGQNFNESNHADKAMVFLCPYCGHTLSPRKDKKHFRIHKCVNPECSYYQNNLAKLPENLDAADETYIKVKGIKHYVWIVMDACKKSILGYQVSNTRSVGPCILAMRMAFEKFKEFPNKVLKFIADGCSAYPLAGHQCKLMNGWNFDVTQES